MGSQTVVQLWKAETEQIHNPFRYCGEYYDQETGLIYLRNRYYDNAIGRFITEDSHWNITNMIYGDTEYNEGEKKTPNLEAILQANNLYVYALNNPVVYVDPTGNDAIWITNEDAVLNLGHTSLLLEDGEGNWYYFYWGLGFGPGIGTKKVVFELIDDSSALESLDGLNKWLEKKGLAGIDTSKNAVYTSATYIEGDFTESVVMAKILNDIWFAGGFYNVLENNCMQVSTDLILLGEFKGKWWIEPILEKSKNLTVPVLADNVVAWLFGNSSYVK